MKALNPSTGNLETVYVKALDSMPVGAEIDFDGQAVNIPVGWIEVDDPQEYSTDEKVIGKWIDGKPLYRQIITGTLTQRSTEINVNLNASINKVAKIEGNLLATATGQAFGINYYLNSTSSTYVKVYVNSASANQNTVGIYQNITGGNVDYFVIIEYTKTTD